MPRVNGIMQLLANVYGAIGSTVASEPYNRTLDDFVNEMNSPRPVTAGGTGVTTISEFKTALNYKLSDLGGVQKAGDQMAGQLTSVVIPHGTLGAVTEEYRYANTSTTTTPNGGNTHSVTVAAGSGTHTINPTGLVEGGTMEINVTYQSGAFAVSGVTEWVLGTGIRTTVFGEIGANLSTGKVYVIALKLAGGVRIGAVL